MLFLIKNRYPILGAILSGLSNVVFLVLGIRDHSMLLILMSAPFLALAVVQFLYRRQHNASSKAQR